MGFSLQWLLLPWNTESRMLVPVVVSPCRRGRELGHTGLVAPQDVGYSWIKDRSRVSCVGRRILIHWATREACKYLLNEQTAKVGLNGWYFCSSVKLMPILRRVCIGQGMGQRQMGRQVALFWMHWVFLAACGFSSCGAWAPEHVGSVVVVCWLSCPTAGGILVPWPGIEPVSPALKGRLFITGPPGKSWSKLLGLQPWLHHLFTMWLWARVSTSAALSSASAEWKLRVAQKFKWGCSNIYHFLTAPQESHTVLGYLHELLNLYNIPFEVATNVTCIHHTGKASHREAEWPALSECWIGCAASSLVPEHVFLSTVSA